VVARFCLGCGSPLRRRSVHGRRRPVCPECGHIHFDDPKVAVGVVAVRRGRLLLVRRNQIPHRGAWSFPSGFVDAGETLEQAAVRETKEETGVEIRVGAQLGAYSLAGNPVVFVAYAARVVSGRAVPGPECQDAAYFSFDDLPPLAFEHDAEILRAWRARKR